MLTWHYSFIIRCNLSELITQISLNQTLEIQLIVNLLMALVFKLFLICTFLVLSYQFFCSSVCIDYTSACFDETPTGCYVCADKIYNMNANITATEPCTPRSQTNLLATELMPNNMNYIGYQSTQYTSQTCTFYTFSGKYTNLDYIQKTFTNIPLNHYAIVVRFSVGYIGNWANTDQLQFTAGDSISTTNFIYNYSCQLPQDICGMGTSDCIRIREYSITHNTSSLFVKFSALTTISDPTIQFWGIKELIIASKMCHSYCLTCFGSLNSECMTCAVGYYLQGNLCLPSCSSNDYTVLDTRKCVSECPNRYYPTVNQTNSANICLKCQSGCVVCSSSSMCQAWETDESTSKNVWTNNIAFFILLILVVSAAIGFIIFKLVKKSLPKIGIEERILQKSDERSNSDNKPKSEEREDTKEITKENERRQKVNCSTLSLQEFKKEKMEHQEIPSESGMSSLAVAKNFKSKNELWFNELGQVEQPAEVKTRLRKRKIKNDDFTNHQIDLASNNQL